MQSQSPPTNNYIWPSLAANQWSRILELHCRAFYSARVAHMLLISSDRRLYMVLCYWSPKTVLSATRLTYNCAHLMMTNLSEVGKKSLLVGIWYWVSKERCWLVLGGNGSVQSSTVTSIICFQKIYYCIVGSTA